VVTAALVTGALAACSAGTPAPAEPTALTSPTPAPADPTPDPVQTFGGLSHEHVTGPVDYPQVPPVGGPHHPRWLACGVYAEPVPAEFAVHSMEHGGIWVTHRPDLPDVDVARLAGLADLDPEYVLVSPLEGLPAPVVASSWGLQLELQTADDGRLAAFVRTYAGGDQGGEPGVPCRTGGLTPEQARDLLADG
jgi:hypothetical protein